MGNRKIVSVVLEVEKDQPEYFRSLLVSDMGSYYCTEIDGVLFIGTLLPSNKYPGSYELLNDLISIKANKETRALIDNPEMSLGSLLMLIERFGWSQ
ncbi:hypothetical protein LCL96_12515 [Rossellomorea aquimaris]|uniref:hypothetical protein n=1 Tax=Rossellomorea aquimaris TaxID=189382 RepID=UPI001CD7ABA3|nr:hypothetical protein [Rossellomorea aquimaris]MCA1059771.1 hypothetical protein [Rossellomorea aquimaris]